ncbi:hypothetical protein RhiirA4_477335 [Rhizophagus irregularis]|uniref:Uncharacterized protein n=1 Tax=Rhizophagus irregularis TaxID=588596 RepID=A0A2I1HD24_9GLOM|nr:hypothetical protein RhiirA4_477335 [Rhizophagus irregularis]
MLFHFTEELGFTYMNYKGTSYTLLDFNSLKKNNTCLQIFTNNKRIIEKYKFPYEINSDRKNANIKFCNKVSITGKISIDNSSKSPRNNETTTYIQFSVRQTTWYFGFHVLFSRANKTDSFSSERNYKEIELTHETKKAELFAKRRIRVDIFFNHTFDENNFATIRAFKEDTLPKKRTATKEEWKIMI